MSTFAQLCAPIFVQCLTLPTYLRTYEHMVTWTLKRISCLLIHGGIANCRLSMLIKFFIYKKPNCSLLVWFTNLARFDFSLRDWILRDFGCDICEIKKGSKVPILTDKFSIFNQKLQLKIEIYLLWFFISPNLTYMQDYNVYKIFKMFSTLKSVQIFNFLCLRFNLARFY